MDMNNYTEALDKYIMDNVDVSNYNYGKPGTYDKAAQIIYEVFCKEKRPYENSVTAFIDWSQGMPSILHCNYWIGGQVYDDLSQVTGFKVTPKMYDIDEACILFSKMLYLEILRGAMLCVNDEMASAPTNSEWI